MCTSRDLHAVILESQRNRAGDIRADVVAGHHIIRGERSNEPKTVDAIPGDNIALSNDVSPVAAGSDMVVVGTIVKVDAVAVAQRGNAARIGSDVVAGDDMSRRSVLADRDTFPSVS